MLTGSEDKAHLLRSQPEASCPTRARTLRWWLVFDNMATRPDSWRSEGRVISLTPIRLRARNFHTRTRGEIMLSASQKSAVITHRLWQPLMEISPVISVSRHTVKRRESSGAPLTPWCPDSHTESVRLLYTVNSQLSVYTTCPLSKSITSFLTSVNTNGRFALCYFISEWSLS